MQKSNLNFGDLKGWILAPENPTGYGLFVHGGPGSHCHYFEQFVLQSPAYKESSIGWIIYDQRGCGESASLGVSTHQENILDLLKILGAVQKRFGNDLKFISGHSYGAWLLYDAMIHSSTSSLPPAFLIGLAHNRLAPRDRNFLMELICTKRENPDSYQEFLARLPELAPDDGWRFKDALRDHVGAAASRDNFYWANLHCMQVYKNIKDNSKMGENDSVFRAVRDSVYLDPVPPLDMSLLPKGSRRIIGYQDWLMGGEGQAVDHATTQVFFKSGHYPHFEQPEAFLNLISKAWEMPL